MKNTRLPPELQAAWEEIETHARDYGLDFFPIIYEVLDYRTLYETAALDISSQLKRHGAKGPRTAEIGVVLAAFFHDYGNRCE